MKRILCLLAIFFILPHLYSQSTDMDYERVKIGDAKHMICGLDLSPDQNVLAISSTQSFPFYLFDWRKKEKLDEFNVGNWYAGSSIRYSGSGKYILLNQLYYLDFSPNKDREVNFELIDAQSGNRLKRFENVHSVDLTYDEKYIVALSGEEVSFYNIISGNKEKSFTVAEASNSIAFSPDGKLIAVSHKLYEKDAKNIAQLQRDKKTLKSALKYKQQISIFDAENFTKLYTVNELYDIVYKLEFSKDGKNLLVLHIPHAKMQNVPSARQTYLNVIDMETASPKRRGFTSKAAYEPDFKLSHNGKLLGIVSNSDRFLELHIYDFETGKMMYRFQQGYRLFEKNEGGMLMVDSRISFVFTPDNQSVFLTMGNHLIEWNFVKETEK
jgi:WD40 repeat protein